MRLRSIAIAGSAAIGAALLSGCYYVPPPAPTYAYVPCTSGTAPPSQPGAPGPSGEQPSTAPATTDCLAPAYAGPAYYPYYYPYYPFPYFYPPVAVGVGFGFRGRFR